QCESGGDWTLSTGNGFYGGLQFTKASWLGAGGGKFAPTANKATKDQQILVAEKLLALQGPGAWPVCGPRAGLGGADGGQGGVPSGVPSSPPASVPSTPPGNSPTTPPGNGPSTPPGNTPSNPPSPTPSNYPA